MTVMDDGDHDISLIVALYIRTHLVLLKTCRSVSQLEEQARCGGEGGGSVARLNIACNG